MTVEELEREYIAVASVVPIEDRKRVDRQWHRKVEGLPNQYAHDLSQAVQIGYAEKARRAALDVIAWNSKRYGVVKNPTRVSLTVLSVIQAAARLNMTGDEIKDGLERRMFMDDKELARIIEKETRYG